MNYFRLENSTTRNHLAQQCRTTIVIALKMEKLVMVHQENYATADKKRRLVETILLLG